MRLGRWIIGKDLTPQRRSVHHGQIHHSPVRGQSSIDGLYRITSGWLVGRGVPTLLKDASTFSVLTPKVEGFSPDRVTISILAFCWRGAESHRGAGAQNDLQIASVRQPTARWKGSEPLIRNIKTIQRTKHFRVSRKPSQGRHLQI